MSPSSPSSEHLGMDRRTKVEGRRTDRLSTEAARLLDALYKRSFGILDARPYNCARRVRMLRSDLLSIPGGLRCAPRPLSSPGGDVEDGARDWWLARAHGAEREPGRACGARRQPGRGDGGFEVHRRARHLAAHADADRVSRRVRPA